MGKLIAIPILFFSLQGYSSIIDSLSPWGIALYPPYHDGTWINDTARLELYGSALDSAISCGFSWIRMQATLGHAQDTLLRFDFTEVDPYYVRVQERNLNAMPLVFPNAYTNKPLFFEKERR